jgi:hypothetical protein
MALTRGRYSCQTRSSPSIQVVVWAPGKGAAKSNKSGHEDIVCQCLNKFCIAAKAGQSVATGGGGGSAPTLANFLKDHMGWSPSNGWLEGEFGAARFVPVVTRLLVTLLLLFQS